MSSRCQCPFSGPADTILGCHRDPITSEKSWLDFAVRELSRAAAGKARGQEAVWRSQCKPAWWDSVCPHPWKNPTANPKDSKDTLKVKFECLVQHLRKVGQLPREMEKEIDLWEADRKPDVFLMTSFSSMLGQASNLHSLVEETCHKTEEGGISFDVAVLNDLQSCLTACVDKLGAIKNLAEKRNQKNSTPIAAGKKRRSYETDSDSDGPSHPPSKQPKRSPLSSPPLSSSSTFTASSLVQSPTPVLSSTLHPTATPSPHTSNAPVSTDQSKMLLAALQKQLLQKQLTKTAVATPPICQSLKTQVQATPKAHPIRSISSRTKGGKKTRVLGVVQRNAAPGVEASVSVLPSACLPASVPQYVVPDIAENTDFQDFLELDLEGSDVSDCQVLSDCQFLDSLLRGTSTDVGANVTFPDPSQSPVLIRTDVVQTDADNHSNHDPFIGHSQSPSRLPESIPFHFDLSEAAAGGQTESEQIEGCIGTALCSGVGDMNRGLQDMEAVSESGYNSESSAATSHRSSLDTETTESINYSDLDSPDLEAYLDSLIV